MPVINVPIDTSRERGARSLAPEGIYDFLIENALLEKDGQGRPRITLKMKVAAQNENQWIGRTLTWRVALRFSDQVGDLLKATGIHYETRANGQGGQSFVFDSDHLVGSFFKARLKHSDDGKWENYQYVEPSMLSNQQVGGQQPAAGAVTGQPPVAPAAPVQQAGAVPPAVQQAPVQQQQVPAQQVAPAQQGVVPQVPVQQQAAPAPAPAPVQVQQQPPVQQPPAPVHVQPGQGVPPGQVPQG